MNLLYYITLLALLYQIRAENNCNNDVTQDNIHYTKETLAENFTMPYHLTIDPNTGTLFFSYSTDNPDDVFKSVYLNLNTKEYDVITGINGSFCHAVDVKNKVVYLGASDGIYQFDYKTKSAHKLNITDMNIWQMFYKDGIYYTVYPNEAAYLYKNGDVTKFKYLEDSKTYLIAVDKDNNVYVTNSTGLYLKEKESELKLIGEYFSNAFTSDMNGNIYFTTPSKVYRIVDKTTVEAIEIKIKGNSAEDLAPEGYYGIAVDMDGNLILATIDSVLRLKSSDDCS